MLRPRLPIVAAGLALAGCAPAAANTGAPAAPAGSGSPAPAAAPARENPFFTASTLPYQAPRFDLIRDQDYQPALEEGMRQQLAEIETIAGQAAAPTFDNTIVAMERSGQLLTRVSKVFGAVVQANSDSTLERVQTEEAPRLAAHSDAIYLNDRLFQRVKSLYDRRASLGLTPEQDRLVERYHQSFVRAGANLSEAGKARMRELNREESTLSTAFTTRLLAATKAAAVVVSDRAELAGLGEAQIAAAAEAAHQRGLDGKWVLPLQNTTQQPVQVSLENRALRQRVFEASARRAEQGDANDTRELIRRLAQLRAQKAQLLGFPTYAAYSLDNQMAKTPDAAIRLLTQVATPANARARAEARRIQQQIDREHGGFTLAPWDWQHYAEQVRRAEYAIDESQVKPYFELDRVLRDGVFFAASQLYGLTFRERHDIPVYHPDVRVFEVFDADGKPLALFYCDYFKRDNKGGGAWMDNFVDQSGLMGTLPVVYNVANFQKPAAGQPALLTFDDVSTMFHEFGHALHGMFSNAQYPTLSGTSVPRDFVEFPSQFNEHWATDPAVFAHYARHYQTGAPMPAELVEKIKRARTFNSGFETSELVQAALLDMAWHTLPASAPPQDVDAFEKQALARYGVAIDEVPPRYRTSYFAHVWGGGYAAGYYAYLWSEVLDDDAFAWFTEHGGLTRANGQRFRDMILSRGGTVEPGALYRAFRGRDPQVGPLLEQRGLASPPASPRQ
ncbi:peptidyl-dipeptidase Dcp [Longimicrobium sp.]|uniref:peptidyl-dipeptidase Dcp n=1 Tax=Longimicrobium sp. TaxID=2029185 RepID=UPI002CC46AD9|nr:peptidyl-dipeptidase Dcp [Longimicrobium sp.]HSU16599.1 peptidyl-dipeptidase Dcp [Longimicrobium sp.]